MTEAEYGQYLYNVSWEPTRLGLEYTKYDSLEAGVWKEGYDFLKPGRDLVQEKIDLIIDRHEKDKLTGLERKEDRIYDYNEALSYVEDIMRKDKDPAKDEHPEPGDGDREIAIEALRALAPLYNWSQREVEKVYELQTKAHHKKKLAFIEYAERKQRKFEEKLRRETEVMKDINKAPSTSTSAAIEEPAGKGPIDIWFKKYDKPQPPSKASSAVAARIQANPTPPEFMAMMMEKMNAIEELIAKKEMEGWNALPKMDTDSDQN